VQNASLISGILSYGELLWDVHPSEEYLGGAPLNLAAHAVLCGVRSVLVSRIGCDPRGKRAAEELKRLRLEARWVQRDEQRLTGWVDVSLRDGEPSYHFSSNAAWDAIALPDPASLAGLLREPLGALACGTLAQRSRISRETLVVIRRELPQVPVFYDVNLRGEETPLEHVQATLPGVHWVKLNEEEAAILARTFFGRDLSVPALASALVASFGVETVIVTRGERGCEIVTSGKTVAVAARPARVVSAVGAGDAFSAAFLAGTLRGLPAEEAARRAVHVAAWVVSRPEAIPDYPQSLQSMMADGESEASLCAPLPE